MLSLRRATGEEEGFEANEPSTRCGESVETRWRATIMQLVLASMSRNNNRHRNVLLPLSPAGTRGREMLRRRPADRQALMLVLIATLLWPARVSAMAAYDADGRRGASAVLQHRKWR